MNENSENTDKKPNDENNPKVNQQEQPVDKGVKK